MAALKPDNLAPSPEPDTAPKKPAPTKKPDGGSDATQCGSRCSRFFVRCAKRNGKRLPQGPDLTQGEAYTLCRGRMTKFKRWKCTANCADTPAMAAFKGETLVPSPPAPAPPAPAKSPPSPASPAPAKSPPAPVPPAPAPPPSPTQSQLDTFPNFAEDACVPALGELKHEKCNGRGHLVSSTKYNYIGENIGEITGAKPIEVRSTKEYCGRCDLPYYG